MILTSLSLGAQAQASDRAASSAPAPRNHRCDQAARPWNKARCTAHDDALRTNGYAAIYIGFLQRWERTSRAVESKPWQSTKKDLKALGDAAQRLNLGGPPNLTAAMSERALRFFNGEIQTNIEMAERLLRHKDLLQAFVEQKRAGLARLKVDLACFRPEGPLGKRFIEHRDQVQREIAEFETFLAALSPLDPKNQDSVFWLKNQWFDSRSWSGSVAKSAFWPYIGPYGSGRYIGSITPDRRTDMDAETTQKLLKTLTDHPGWPFNRCEGGRYEGEDARVRTIYMRGANLERDLYSYFNSPITKGFTLPEAARFSQRVDKQIRTKHFKFFPWQKPSVSYDADEKAFVYHGIYHYRWGARGRGGMIPVPIIEPWHSRTRWPTRKQVLELRKRLARP